MTDIVGCSLMVIERMMMDQPTGTSQARGAAASRACGGGQPPCVSVIIPTYNSAAYLPQAIQSVLDQDFDDFEIIIVDDGSTDDTSTMLAPFRDQVRCVRQENRGNAAARNRGLAEARAEWLCFLDSDDTWLPGKLRQQWDDLRAHPEAGWSFTGAQKVYESGETEPFPPDPAEQELWDRLVLGQPFGASHSGLMVHRSCFEQVGGFDENLRLSVDWDIFIRLARRFQVRNIPDVLVNHRRHSSNTTRNAELRLSMYLACLRKHRRLFCEELDMRRQWRQSYGARLFRYGRYRVKQGRYRDALPLLTQSLRYGGMFQLRAKIVLAGECVMRLVGGTLARRFSIRASRSYPQKDPVPPTLSRTLD